MQCEWLRFEHASDLRVYKRLRVGGNKGHEREGGYGIDSLQVSYTLFSQHDCERDYI